MNETNNACYASEGLDSLSTTHRYLLGSVNTIIAITNVFLNLSLSLLLKNTNQLGRLSSKLIICLSISDCCIGLIAQPILTYMCFTDGNNTSLCQAEKTWRFLSVTLGEFSGLMILVISIDRYVHMRYLHKYQAIMTKRRAVTLIVAVMFASLLAGISSTVLAEYNWFFAWFAALMCIDSLVIITIFALYTKTFLSVKQHVGSLTMTASNSNKQNQPQTSNYSHRLGKAVILILMSTVVSYIPYFAVKIVYFYYLHVNKVESPPQLMQASYWVYLLVYANSSLNAVIFGALNKKITRVLFSSRTVSSVEIT